MLIRWLLHPDIGDPLSGVLVPMGPEHWGPQSEEWVFHMQFLHGDSRAFDDAFVVEHMHRILLIPDFHPEIHVISRWEMEGIVASRLRVGNVFLLGDSAHRHPPTGALASIPARLMSITSAGKSRQWCKGRLPTHCWIL